MSLKKLHRHWLIFPQSIILREVGNKHYPAVVSSS